MSVNGLKQSQIQSQHIRQLIDLNRDPTFVIDPDSSVILDANTRACQSLGYSHEEMLVLSVTDISVSLISHDDWLRRSDHIKASVNGLTFESRHRKKDQTSFPVEISAVFHADTTYNTDGIIIASVRDITARTQATESLNNYSELLRLTGRIAHVGGWELKASTLEFHWTDETFHICEMDTDYSPTLEDALQLVHPDDQSIVKNAMNKALESGQAYDLQYRLITAKGNIRWIRGICDPEIVDGEIVWLRGTIQDITEAKNNEDAITKSALEWTHALDFFEDAIYIIGLDDKVKRVNQAFYNMTGLSPDQVIGQDITSIIHPHGEKIPCPVCLARLERRDEFITMEADHPDNPTNNPIEIMVRIIRNEAGDPLSVLMGIHDLSRTRAIEKSIMQNELRYRTIFEGAPEGIWMIDPDRKTLEINSHLTDMLGYSEKEMIGTRPIDYVDDENKQIFLQQMSKIPATTTRNYEIELRHKDGHNIPTHFSAVSLFNPDKSVMAAIAFVTDLSTQKQTEQALRRSQKMDAIGQITGGIAHDFNNLLSIIIGHLGLLEEELKSNAASSKRLKTINKATKRATDLTRQLLGFSRSQAQNIEVTNVNNIIQAMDSLIARSVTPEVEVKLKLASNIWPTEINKGDFEDSLLNLVINARDAMPDGGKLRIETSNQFVDEITANKKQLLASGDYVHISVCDTGTGISDEHLDKIFEPFFTTKPIDKGTGLGLSMVFGFIKRSHGYINAHSQIGSGSCFELYLPRKTMVRHTAEQLTPTYTQIPGGNEKVLIVEDETSLLELAKENLTDLGYSVLTASNGPEALKILDENNDIDLLFTDIIMPGNINGYELAEKASTLYPNIKILLTSGFTGKVASKFKTKNFFTNMLNKPYNRSSLAQMLRKTLDQQLY